MFGAVWRRRDPEAFGSVETNHVELTLVTPPAIEPVSVTELKRQARIVYADSDEQLAIYIQAARDQVEGFLRRALITQTWDFVSDFGPAWIELPKAPIQSIVGVFTTGLDNVEVTVPPAVYLFAQTQNMVGLNIGEVWPLHRGKAGFRVRYIAGYGDTPATVPVAIRHYIMALATHFDDVRDQSDMPMAANAALRRYRVEGQPFRMSRGRAREDVLA